MGRGVNPVSAGVIEWKFSLPTSGFSFSVEVQRTSDNGSIGPATSAWETITEVPPPARGYKDSLPLDGERYHYQFRAVKPGYTASTYFGPVSAIAELIDSSLNPRVLYEDERSRRLDTIYETDVSGLGVIKADVGVVDSGTLLVTNSTGAASSITKTIRVPCYGIQTVTATGFEYQTFLSPETTAIILQCQMGFVLPPGVTVTQVSARMYRDTANDRADGTFYSVDDDAGLTALSTFDHNTTGWQTVATSSMAEVVQSTEMYFLLVELDSTGLSNRNTRILWGEVEYKMPSYDKAY